MKNFSATPNYSARTFTLRVNGSKYRTNPLSKAEFNEMEYNTAEDWAHFLRSSQNYYIVK